jgi:hypothetical protein
MSFRRRMILLAAGAVAAAVAIASVVVYVVTRDELRGQIDASLRQKLTPGQPQAVQVKTETLTRAQLAKLEREGKLPPGALSHLGRNSASGSVTAKAPNPGRASTGGAELTGRITSVDGKNVVVWSRAPGCPSHRPPARSPPVTGRRSSATPPSPARTSACSPNAPRPTAYGRWPCR